MEWREKVEGESGGRDGRERWEGERGGERGEGERGGREGRESVEGGREWREGESKPIQASICILSKIEIPIEGITKRWRKGEFSGTVPSDMICRLNADNHMHKLADFNHLTLGVLIQLALYLSYLSVSFHGR